MNLKVRRFVAAFVVFSVIALLILLIANYRGEGGLKVTAPETRNIGVKMDRVRYSSSREGRTEWELEAEEATRLKNEDVMRLRSVSLRYYPATGKPYVLKSREGALMESAGVMSAEGDVVLTFEGGYELRTSRLDYSMKKREMTSDEEARILSKGMDITGRGIVIEPDKGRVRLLKDVKAVIKAGPA